MRSVMIVSIPVTFVTWANAKELLSRKGGMHDPKHEWANKLVDRLQGKQGDMLVDNLVSKLF